MEWRKRWEKNWDEVKYCSDHCRKANKTVSANLKARIMAELHRPSHPATICPSEILPHELKTDPHEMEKVREAARLLVADGLIEICQKGQVVDPSAFRGPIRLRLKKNSAAT